MIAIATLSGVHASAQSWEYVYGGNYNERGYDVKPVRRCDSSGYIAVGSTTSNGNGSTSGSLLNEDVYVVRTAANGTRIWERYYDFQSDGLDIGWSVVELSDSSGYVVAGYTKDTITSVAYAFLMKLDCDGAVVWSMRYNPGLTDLALDVVEATLGNGITTNPGDLLVCGTSQVAGGSYDGLVFRVSAVNGAIIWSSRILLGGAASVTSEVLFDLIEITGAVGAGDVVAVGGADMLGATGVQGYVVRLNGNTGAIGAAPQGLALYGGANDESFEGVRELSVGNEATHLVMCGLTEPPTGGGASDIYMVKTLANPCVMLVQGVVGGSSGTFNEQARDIIEVTANGMFPGQPTFALGDLALTGFADIGGQLQPRMLLLPVRVGTLTGLQGEYFQRDEGYALLGESDGFVLCGHTNANLENDVFPDPQDLYLVRTNADGKTECAADWACHNTEPSWTGTCPTGTINTTNPMIVPTITKNEYSSPNSVCPPPVQCIWCKPAVTGGSESTNTSDLSLRLRTTPNPLTHGSRLHLEIEGAVQSSIDVVIYDLTGQRVFVSTVQTTDGRSVLDIPSDSWPSGSYTVMVFDDGRATSTSVLIVP